MIVICDRKEPMICGYQWDYRGVADFFASCPRCHKPIKLKMNTKKIR